MSRNRVNQTDGSLTQIAGRGKAEYGASTVRTGSFNIPQHVANSVAQATVTFDTPMPDNDYVVVFNLPATNWSGCSMLDYDKTANGFKVQIATIQAQPGGYKGYYTAFKLYTDTEYNSILDTVDSLNGSWVDISSDASAYIDSGYIKYKKIGQLVIVKMWAVLFKADSTGAGNTLSTNLPTCDDAATNRIFRDQKDGLGALYINTNSKTLLCHHKLPTGDTTQTSWYGEMVYTTSD